MEGEVVIQRQFAFLLQRLEHIQIMVYHALVGSAAWHEAVESQLGISLLDTYSVSGGWGELCEEHGVHSASHIDDDVIVGAMHDMIYLFDISEEAMALLFRKGNKAIDGGMSLKEWANLIVEHKVDAASREALLQRVEHHGGEDGIAHLSKSDD